MLFYEAEIFSFSKNINSIGPFPDPLSIPLLYIVCEGKILIMGECQFREGEQGERAKKTDELD